jgi:hypothetical protein
MEFNEGIRQRVLQGGYRSALFDTGKGTFCGGKSRKNGWEFIPVMP